VLHVNSGPRCLVLCHLRMLGPQRCVLLPFGRLEGSMQSARALDPIVGLRRSSPDTFDLM